MHNDVTQFASFTWDLQNLAQGSIDFNIAGKKVPIIGDFTLSRSIKLLVKGDDQAKPPSNPVSSLQPVRIYEVPASNYEVEVTWNGQFETNMISALTTPLITTGKISFIQKTLKVEINQDFNSENLTLLINTRPFKFALHPFFEM